MRRLFLGSGRSVLQGIPYPSYGTERALKMGGSVRARLRREPLGGFVVLPKNVNHTANAGEPGCGVRSWKDKAVAAESVEAAQLRFWPG